MPHTEASTDEPPHPDLTKPAVLLREPRHKLDARATTWWLTRAAIGWLVIIIPQNVVLIFRIEPWQVMAMSVSVAVAIMHCVCVPLWRFRIHRWELTPEALYIRTGWLRITWEIVPLSRVQTVKTHRGPLERRFGLASVVVTTASAHGAVRLMGLSNVDAVTLADTLTHRAHATPGDAT